MANRSNSETRGPASRWPEVRAVLGWWVRSWLRPAGDSLRWEQHAGYEPPSGTGAGEQQGPPQSGGNTESNRQQNIKQTPTC